MNAIKAESKTSRRRCDMAVRRHMALRLRQQGKSYREIASELGISRATAHKYVTATLELLNQKAEGEAAELRRLEFLRLDSLFEVVYTKAAKGDLRAVDRCLRVMERRAKLAGLDAPERSEVTDIPPPSESEIQRAAQEILVRNERTA